MKLRNFFMGLFILPASLIADQPIVDLGPLQVASVVVNDLEAAVAQWSAGTGTEFSPITTNDYIVFLSDGGPKHVTIKSAYSIYSNPFLELIEVTPAIGPWAPQTGPGSTVGYQVYAVSNIHQVDATMVNAGLTKVAFSGNKFAFYQAANGLLVKVINQNLLPPTGGVNTPQAPIDIGPIKHADMAIVDSETLKQQFGTLLSINWSVFQFTNTPMTFPEGTELVDVDVVVSDKIPQIQFEKITPPLGVFASSPTSYTFHPAYVVPAGTMDAVRAQMESAGFVLNTYVILPDVGLVLAYFVGPGNYWIEVVDARFDF